jgi:LacI family transcriptional regulator
MEYGYARAVLRGMRQYRPEREAWQIVPASPTPNLAGIFRQGGAGAVGLFAGAGEQDAAALDVPVVNISSSIARSILPQVIPDNHRIGALAAEHLLERGFTRFICAHFGAVQFSVDRSEGFRARLAEAGFDCAMVQRHPEQNSDWTDLLTPPIGVFAVADNRGAQILMAAQRMGLDVPHDVAVLGVDNDEVLCEMGAVGLTSVDPEGERVGYEAAALLDRMIAGEPLPDQPILIEPQRVVVRTSTDTVAVADPRVSQAARIIRNQACNGLNVDQVLDEVMISRRWLEKQFKAAFGRTPLQEIRRVQMDHAKQLLAETDLRIPDVAVRCGFGYHNRFTNTFTREVGMPPTRYRNQFRIRDTTS